VNPTPRTASDEPAGQGRARTGVPIAPEQPARWARGGGRQWIGVAALAALVLASTAVVAVLLVGRRPPCQLTPATRAAPVVLELRRGGAWVPVLTVEGGQDLACLATLVDQPPWPDEVRVVDHAHGGRVVYVSGARP
jgi:hypothetical protein